jgi:hypothetical protein
VGAGGVLPVDARSQHRGRVPVWPSAFPARLLVIDEFGTFASMAERMHRRRRGQGSPPALDQRRQIEWQGRQACV